jgi:cytochrome c oxidase subunit II
MPLLDLACLLQTQLTGPAEHRITNIFQPLATPAKSEYALALFVFSITGAIFLVVAGLLTYALVRFRRKDGDESNQEPPQVYGSNQIEIAWTVIPILIVFSLLGVTARMVISIEDAKPTKSPTNITVIGHQFWWEIKYPELGVFTANELHVPLADSSSHASYLKLESVDVAHSLWVPQLAGKTDLIPNRDNSMWFDPREPGVYLGNCTEFCGVQHANMRLRVIVHPQAEFEQWVAAQKKEVEPEAPMAANRAVYESLSCVSCHTIQGTRSRGIFGPDLSHLMSRQTLGAGAIDNTLENLRAWVNDPQEAKPGCLMPSLKLDKAQLDAVVAYLFSLK